MTREYLKQQCKKYNDKFTAVFCSTDKDLKVIYDEPDKLHQKMKWGDAYLGPRPCPQQPPPPPPVMAQFRIVCWDVAISQGM